MMMMMTPRCDSMCIMTTRGPVVLLDTTESVRFRRFVILRKSCAYDNADSQALVGLDKNRYDSLRNGVTRRILPHRFVSSHGKAARTTRPVLAAMTRYD